MDLVGVLRRGGPPGADRPDRLVGDHELRHLPRRQSSQPDLQLAPHHRLDLTPITFVELLPDAEHWSQALSGDRRHLSPHRLVRVAEDMAAFGVPCQHEGRAGVAGHRRRDRASKGARCFPVDVLDSQL